jgi:hypothetical protein
MRFSARKAGALLLIAFAAYVLYVLFAGLGFNPLGARWDFSLTGELGDSFGPINTLMALVAAVAAIAAYFAQSAELERLRASSEVERTLATKRDFETTFFNLLQLFRETVKEIDAPDQYNQNAVRGRDALKRILEGYIGGTRGNDAADASAYSSVYDRFRDDLAHYFRLFYQILRLVDHAPVSDKMLYVRLLRATLSNAEIVLIALNCLYGGGKQKLKPLVEQYAVLHNISAADARSWRFLTSFHSSAFGDRRMDAPSDEASD